MKPAVRKQVTVSIMDDVRIEVTGEGRAHTIPARTILHAFEHEPEAGTAEYLARGVLQYAELLEDLKALDSDQDYERGLRKQRMHVAGLVYDARKMLGLEPYPKGEV